MRHLMLPALALLAACAEPGTTSTPTSATGSSATTAPRDVVPVKIVAAAFREICLDRAPSFEGAEPLLPSYGLTRTAATGTVFHPSGTMSLKIQAAQSASGQEVRRCSLVHEDPDSAAETGEIQRLIGAIGGKVTGTRETSFRTPDGGTRPGTVWTVSVDGRDGELMHIPYQGPRKLGSFILQFRLQLT